MCIHFTHPLEMFILSVASINRLLNGARFSRVWAGCCSLFYSPACGAARLLETSLPTSAKLEPLIAVPFCGSESTCFLSPELFGFEHLKVLLSNFFTTFHKSSVCNPSSFHQSLKAGNEALISSLHNRYAYIKTCICLC